MFASTTFTFKNVFDKTKADIAEITLPQVVTISPTLVYNKDYSLKAAVADSVVILDGGVVRVPLFGGRQWVEIKPGETFTVNTQSDAETAFYTNLTTRYDGKAFYIETTVSAEDDEADPPVGGANPIAE